MDEYLEAIESTDEADKDRIRKIAIENIRYFIRRSLLLSSNKMTI
jgi:hypothetical protein